MKSETQLQEMRQRMDLLEQRVKSSNYDVEADNVLHASASSFSTPSSTVERAYPVPNDFESSMRNWQSEDLRKEETPLARVADGATTAVQICIVSMAFHPGLGKAMISLRLVVIVQIYCASRSRFSGRFYWLEDQMLESIRNKQRYATLHGYKDIIHDKIKVEFTFLRRALI